MTTNFRDRAGATALALMAIGLGGVGCGGSQKSSTPGDGENADSGGTPSGNNVTPEATDASTASVPIPCASAATPSTLKLTVSGFMTCSCFNGTFTLTLDGSGTGEPPLWASPSITGCPTQQQPAYFKLSTSLSSSYDAATKSYVVTSELGLGITDESSDPGSGDSDFAPATSYTCSPLTVSGGGSEAGNINGFCNGTEDENMKWSITQ